ncbi:MAG: serine/threonine protein kinase [Polyangiaceae bacterium]
MERVGRYVIFDPIASGGMASVHLGRMVGPLGFARTVAVKRLHKHLATDSEFAVMLLDEARLTGRIQHPFVVQTLDVVSEHGELLIVMEYVHGLSLAKLRRAAVDRKEPIDPAIAAAITIQLLGGLHAAHEATDESGAPLHLVHRDVSPQNVLVGTDGIAKVLDFGVAKALGRMQTTREGQIKGKLAYMAPEQLRSHAVDRRTDLFAASIVLWELLTGERLFAGSEDETIGKVLAATVDPPSTKNGGRGGALDAVVMKGLSRESEKRFATAQEMARAIEAALPPASPAKVGGWVEALAHEELAERKVRIAEIERAETTLASTVSSTSVREDGETQSAAVAHVSTSEKSAHRSTIAVSLIVVAAIALAAGGGYTLARASRATTPSVLVATPSISSESRLPLPSSTSVAPLPPSTGVTAPIASEAPSASAIDTAAAMSKKHVHTPVKAASPAPTVDCRDPYVLDAQGRKRYRRECLGSSSP